MILHIFSFSLTVPKERKPLVTDFGLGTPWSVLLTWGLRTGVINHNEFSIDRPWRASTSLLTLRSV